MSSTPPKDKPRLSEQEKKSNHIASEQKRRQAIRDGFDRLAAIVPGMAGQGRSENAVLQATIIYMTSEVEEYHRLMAHARIQGVNVSDLEIEGVDSTK